MDTKQKVINEFNSWARCESDGAALFYATVLGNKLGFSNSEVLKILGFMERA